MKSNAPEALLCKDSGKRSADFCAAVRRKSNGIFMSALRLGLENQGHQKAEEDGGGDPAGGGGDAPGEGA